MPVDLSMIGLEGQKAYDDHRLSQEMTRVQKAAAIAKEFETQQAERDAALDQEVAKLFSDLAQGKSPPGAGEQLPEGKEISRADALMMAGDRFGAGGAWKRQQDAYEMASKIEKQELEEQNAVVDNRYKQLQSQLMTSDFIARTLGSAKNQSEYEHAMEQVMSSEVLSEQDKAHLSQLPGQWSPEITRYLSDQAISAKDAAQNELTERYRDQTDRQFTANERYRANRLAMDQAKLDEQKRQRDLQERTGKTAAVPTDQELDSVAAAVRNQIPSYADVKFKTGRDAKGELTSQEIAFSAGVNSVAARAKVIFKDTPSIDWDTAVNRAIMESKQAGDWREVTTSLGPVKLGSEQKFARQGTSPDNAIPMPKVKTKMVAGRYYITTKGSLRWNGSAFDLP